MRWRGPIRQPAMAAGTTTASPLPGVSRTAKNRPTGMRGIRQSGEQSCAPVMGQNGRGSASERFCGPLVLPRRCPLYVRGHCHASTRNDTP